MKATLHRRWLATIAAGFVAVSVSAQDSSRQTRQPAAAPDVDPQLTSLLQRREQDFVDAIVRKDTNALDRIVAPEYALRIADVPQGSMPRAMWMANTLERLKAESAAITHCTSRKLAADLAATSLVFTQKGSMDGRDFSGVFYIVDLWRESAGNWQVIARYSGPMGKGVERSTRPVPPPADVDSSLTDSLTQLERRLGEVVRGRFTDRPQIERLVGSEFTLRTSDAPATSLTRTRWMQAGSGYALDSLAESLHAARRLADDLGVVTFVMTEKATRDGRDRSRESYLIDIWKRRDGRWQLITRYVLPRGVSLDRPSPT